MPTKEFLYGVIISSLFYYIFQNFITYDLLGVIDQLHPQTSLLLRPLQPQSDVRNTCRIVSGWRAMDSIRENSVYYQQDPLAIFLAGSDVIHSVTVEAPQVYRTPAADNEIHSVTLRQLAIDNRIIKSCKDNDKPIRQVVLIGSGMDTRSYRLALPDVHWFEIDMPEVIALKEDLLENGSIPQKLLTLGVKECTRIAFNLKDSTNLSSELPDVLASHGHHANEPTLFLMEGLLMYLSPTDIRNLMDGILPAVAPHSRVIMTQVSFMYHYLLTNPLVIFLIEQFSNSKSHKIGTLFKSNTFSMRLGPEWRVRLTRNVGVEMMEDFNLTQWQPKGHVAGSPPQVVSTAESVLEVELSADRAYCEE